MIVRRKPFERGSATEVLLLRECLGLGRYRKTGTRDPAERELLLELALRKIAKSEENDYFLIGFRKRRVSF